jgi:hypothetical protein
MLRMIGRNLSKDIFHSPAWGVMCITGGVAQRNRRFRLLPNKALQGRDNFMIFALLNVLIMSSLRDFVGVSGLLFKKIF